MKSFFIIGVFLLGLNSCSLSDGRDYSDLDMTNVIYEYNKKLSKEKLIELSSIYLDYNYNEESRGKIKGVDVRYSVSKRIQEEEAREWFRELIDGLLEKINSTEYLRKYFQHYPSKL